MEIVYECENSKKKDLLKIIEADPYEERSFARVGYKLKDGEVIGQDKEKCYLYIKSDDGFFKIAEKKLEGIVKKCEEKVSKEVIEKIKEEEEQATSGFGDIFG
ncbi:MAG: hypothetical protein PHU63_01880 [Candidatus ainarchaeum sp.]|nr:hypothetical protein [Candidatus ainarchaeum sp.]